MAATLTDELTYVSFPIEKFETNDDGDLIVYGKATDGSVDSDEQIVKPEWSAKAIAAWLETGGNVRVQHNAQRDPAGKGLAVDITPDGHFVRSLIVEPNAKRLVEKGILRAYSVGIARPVIERDITGKARGGIITGGELAEISLVDRPANKNCAFTLVKADKSGDPEWVGKLSGTTDFLAKGASPVDVAKMVKQRKDAGQIAHSYSDPIAQRLADALAAESEPTTIMKRDFSADERRDAADSGEAMPNGSFPIKNKDDLHNAIRLAGNAEDPDAARAHIKRRAAALDASDMIPDTWKIADGDVAKGDEPDANAVQPVDKPATVKADAKPDDKDEDDATPSSDDDEDGTTSSASTKAKKPAFGEKKAPPFGKKPKGDAKGDEGKEMEPDDTKGAEIPAWERALLLQKQIADLQAELAKCTPTGTSAGVEGKDSDPAPAGRGGATLDSPMGNAIHPDQLWGKAIQRTTDAPYTAQRVHDATCAAYSPIAVKAAYPALAHPGLACDPMGLREEALAAVAAGDLARGEHLLGVAKAAEYLSGADALAVADAMAGLHKSFMDMYPSVRLSPGQIMPQRFSRPYISDGHARMPAPSGDTTPGSVPSYHPDAADFRRGPMTAGHEAPSPGSKGSSNPYPAGTPVDTIYQHAAQAQRESAACRTIHDHYAAQWNGVCPMSSGAGPVRPSGSLPVGKGKKARKKGDRKPPEEFAAMDPIPAMPGAPASTKAVAAPVSVSADISVMLSRVEREMKKLRKQHDDQIAELTKSYQTHMQSQATDIETLRRSVDELGSQPYAGDAPNVSIVAKAASSVVAAERRSLLDEAGERIRAEKLDYLHSLATSGDPATREGAQAQIRKLLST